MDCGAFRLIVSKFSKISHSFPGMMLLVMFVNSGMDTGGPCAWANDVVGREGTLGGPMLLLNSLLAARSCVIKSQTTAACAKVVVVQIESTEETLMLSAC
ncbi:hypothetical protein KUCAC02_021203 [Chaenocephalus aceratus]|uniref:Uncharacterized protein n=1 Tax=Chaenocephalus aceratus TaxID=36190 RepID=A0ACB9XFN7_CHAAC|nr:hypothetical protein KUCAC02_021203 [Chaenocephalus aceratus]